MNRLRMTRWTVRGIVATLTVLVGSFWAWRHAVDNFGVVISGPNPVSRSDQMDPEMLAKTIQELGIRTVLNLRGPNPGDGWYDRERAATLSTGAVQIDMPLSSCDWMSRDQAQSLAEVLRDAPRPLLIHCFHGSERTGLASAMTRLLTEGQSLEEARKSFSWKYMFFGLGDGVVTLRQFQQYENWLADNHQTHSPTRFMTWLNTDFKPQSPSREQWPYDPYPLVIRSYPAQNEHSLAQKQNASESSRK